MDKVPQNQTNPYDHTCLSGKGLLGLQVCLFRVSSKGKVGESNASDPGLLYNALRVWVGKGIWKLIESQSGLVVPRGGRDPDSLT